MQLLVSIPCTAGKTKTTVQRHITVLKTALILDATISQQMKRSLVTNHFLTSNGFWLHKWGTIIRSQRSLHFLFWIWTLLDKHIKCMGFLVFILNLRQSNQDQIQTVDFYLTNITNITTQQIFKINKILKTSTKIIIVLFSFSKSRWFKSPSVASLISFIHSVPTYNHNLWPDATLDKKRNRALVSADALS